MKKTILMILAVLPIVLVVIIAFAGRILSVYQHISVERVVFVSENGEPYGKDGIFKVEEGTSAPLSVVVYPELASNKTVTYHSDDESVCKVDKNGVVTGIHYGSATVTVKTEDGGKTAMIAIVVTRDTPVDVTLDHNELKLTKGQQFTLGVYVESPVAVDKRVVYTSDNPDVVTVDSRGMLTAVSVGTAVITVRTVSGNLTDTCTVTVEDGNLPISFDFSEIDGIRFENGMYIVNTETVNILECMKLGDGVEASDVTVKRQSGGSAVYEDGVVTFSKEGIVHIRAYIGDEESPEFFVDIKLFYQK